MQQLFCFSQHQTRFNIAKTLDLSACFLVLLFHAVQLLIVYHCVNDALYPELFQLAFPVVVFLDARFQTHDTLQVFIAACHTQRIVIRLEQYLSGEYELVQHRGESGLECLLMDKFHRAAILIRNVLLAAPADSAGDYLTLECAAARTADDFAAESIPPLVLFILVPDATFPESLFQNIMCCCV